MNEELQLEDFKISLLAVWKKKTIVIVAMIITTLVGILYTYGDGEINMYSAGATVMGTTNYSDTTNTTTAINLTNYAEIITSSKVCERAASLVGGEITYSAQDIQDMVGVTTISDTVLDIYATADDPETAIAVTNAVAEAFVREVTSLTGSDSVQILDPAESVSLDNNGFKEVMIKRMIFALAGAGIAGLYIMVTELTSNKIRTVSQCISDDESEIIGIIPFIE